MYTVYVQIYTSSEDTQNKNLIYLDIHNLTSHGVHEMHDRMHPKYSYVTNLFDVSILYQLAYLIISHTHHLACNKLPTANKYVYMYMYTLFDTCIMMMLI